MKTKHFNKKLELNKHTVSHLNDGELSGVRGGVATGYTCVGYCNTVMSCGPTQCAACITEMMCTGLSCNESRELHCP